ncbi:cytochrome b561 and DOMON domain-containing protein At5g47530-like [Sesamum indicum]|uniref:Cytochrome b561 and DOMON domain-containing protein At5g47530-like n=1 Tax=Sesamum indicum TaxID=4182 RepID=A0A6I9UPV9_SESIN|nr:cytochrome b561 and DOMON domain-containing protein At5g47530-like [Sesamum indicum]
MQPMASFFKVNLLLKVLVSVFVASSAETCSNSTFSLNRVYNSCSDLPYFGAHLHWNYIPSLRKVSIAYRARQISTGWIAWAINPTGTGMVGSQALVAFRNDNGSMTVYPTSITSYNPSMLPGELSFQVSNISAEYKHNEMTIYAIVGPLENGTIVNHVWQAGNSVSSNIPQIHSMSSSHLQSMGKIDFQKA